MKIIGGWKRISDRTKSRSVISYAENKIASVVLSLHSGLSRGGAWISLSMHQHLPAVNVVLNPQLRNFSLNGYITISQGIY